MLLDPHPPFARRDSRKRDGSRRHFTAEPALVIIFSQVPPGGAQCMMRAGHTLSILKKEHGKWVLARDANMLVPV